MYYVAAARTDPSTAEPPHKSKKLLSRRLSDAVVARMKNGSASPSIDMTVSPALFDTIWHLSAVQPSTATQNSSYVYRREDRSTMKCRHRLSSVSPDQGTIGRSFGSSYCSFYAAPSSQMGGLKHDEVPPSF